MRAVVTDGKGDLKFSDRPVPEPGPGEVRIAVAAAGVNPVDMATRDGYLHASVVPAGTTLGLGWDVAGIVDAVGADVTSPAVGTRVVGLRPDPTTPLGTYADFVVLPVEAVASIPDGLDTVAAASIPLNILTADQALDLAGPVGTLLVTGAAGGVGGYAVALAAHRGWTVTALARDSDREFVLNAGAASAIGTVADAGSFDAVLDAAALGATAIAAVRDDGHYVGVLPPAIPEPVRGVSAAAVSVRHDGGRLAQLLRLVSNGTVEVRVAGTLSLDHARKAQDEASTPGVRGRWLLTP
ncbi:NADP-dependent oxidoreductase [Rhodococcus sp. 077-4]|uniref:NADP-dependent oxidoreductase n=1 Tax=Rhodococcus sp. 077-4 TaxID=2789271 RepID=UPI0039F49340